MMKLNIGSGPKKIEGYKNIDALPWNGVTDLVFDVTIQQWEFTPWQSVDEILMVEFLEHVSFRKTEFVLDQAYKVLKYGGKIIIQVPDCGSMMEAYINGQVNEVIPHKPESTEQALLIQKETGYKVHPNRFLFAFMGAQKHQYDSHLNIFTKEKMQEYLENAGFININFLIDPLGWKIKVVAEK